MMDFARDIPVLSLVVFTPVIGVLILLLVPGDRPSGHSLDRAAGGAGHALASACCCSATRPAGRSSSIREEVEWIPAFGMGYRLGVDGLSVALVILTTVLSVVAILYSWDPIQTRVKEYYATMLLLMVGMLGVFVSLDLFLFYVFWELSLIPMYLVIGIWGGPRRIYATVKFVIYTLVGSLLMLVAILAVAIAYAVGRQRLHLQLRAAARLPLRRWAAGAGLHRLLPGLRHQGADVAAAYLAARCPRRGADRRLHHPGRRAAEAGRLRLPALQPAAAARCGGRVRADRHRAGGDRHPVRSHGQHGAAGPEEADRLLQRVAHGLRDAGRLRVQRPGPAGRHLPDDQPRHHHRRPLPAGRA